MIDILKSLCLCKSYEGPADRACKLTCALAFSALMFLVIDQCYLLLLFLTR